MLGWFRALMPREERFFELFTRHAQVTVAGAVLCGTCSTARETWSRAARRYRSARPRPTS